jgi:hypothetical protein
MKKSKKDRKSGEVAIQGDESVAGPSNEDAVEQVTYTSPIAQPMASSKVTKKIRKLIKASMYFLLFHDEACSVFCIVYDNSIGLWFFSAFCVDAILLKTKRLIKYSRASSPVNWVRGEKTNVSRTISFLVFRVLM